MTAAEAHRELVRMHESLAYFTEAQCRRVNELIDIINEERMATKVKGSVTKDGKFKPADRAPVSAKIARKAKADRTEKGLRKNREAKA